MDKKALIKKIEKEHIQFIDLRFTDILGKDHHMTIPVSSFNDDLMVNGKSFDGSSFQGWQPIHHSDLVLIPDLTSVARDPFYQDPTLAIRCNVFDPMKKERYERDPRCVAERAEAYLASTGIASSALFGPEPEFFMFDDVRWETSINHAFYRIDSEEGHWNSGKDLPGGNTGHRPGLKGGYVPLPPIDSAQDIRSAMSKALESVGIVVEVHHHEVGTGNQGEIATRFNTLTKKADELQWLKYIVRNVAHQFGKTATFMPKPLVGENGNGMHCHQSLMKDGVNLFAGDGYAGLSTTALYYIGGIIRHARALNAFTNPAVNSYRRLVPGFEAPVLLAYAACNRSASIRIPNVSSPKAARIEVRFPDPCANPYLAFSAMMMAGLDGIQQKMHPGEAMDHDLYELPDDEVSRIPSVARSLEEAMEYLERDHAFLLQGNVFSLDLIQSHLAQCKKQVEHIRTLVHPYEFELYYSA